MRPDAWLEAGRACFHLRKPQQMGLRASGVAWACGAPYVSLSGRGG